MSTGGSIFVSADGQCHDEDKQRDVGGLPERPRPRSAAKAKEATQRAIRISAAALPNAASLALPSYLSLLAALALMCFGLSCVVFLRQETWSGSCIVIAATSSALGARPKETTPKICGPISCVAG